jgi:hypothetical protein
MYTPSYAGGQTHNRQRSHLLKTPDGCREFPVIITDTVLIRISRRVMAKKVLHRQSHSCEHTRDLTDHEGNPCETYMQGAPHLNDAEKGGHHI